MRRANLAMRCRSRRPMSKLFTFGFRLGFDAIDKVVDDRIDFGRRQRPIVRLAFIHQVRLILFFLTNHHGIFR